MTPLAASAIIDEVAVKHRLSRCQMMVRTRQRYIARARWEAMRRLRDERGMTLPAIGLMFGLHHTTVLHGIRGLA